MVSLWVSLYLKLYEFPGYNQQETLNQQNLVFIFHWNQQNHVFQMCKKSHQRAVARPMLNTGPLTEVGQPKQVGFKLFGTTPVHTLAIEVPWEIFPIENWNPQKFLGHAYGWQFLDGPRPKGFVESIGRKRKTTLRFTSKGNRAVDLEGSWPSKHITVYVLYVPDFCNTKIMCITPAWREMYHQSRNKRDNFSSTLDRKSVV